MHLLTGSPEQCVQLSKRPLVFVLTLCLLGHNLSLAQIMLRQWKAGWKGYADTLGIKHREARDYGVPDWNGEPGTVLVYGEQGVVMKSCLHLPGRSGQNQQDSI